MNFQNSPNFYGFKFVSGSADVAAIRNYFQQVARLSVEHQVSDRFFKFWFSPFVAPDKAAILGVKALVEQDCQPEFLESFQDSIYLILLAWAQARCWEACREFLERLDRHLAPPSLTSMLLPYRVRQWFKLFYGSLDYADLQRAIALLLQMESPSVAPTRWSDRYFEFCLKALYLDRNLPQSQQDFSGRLALYIQKRFQRDLALYVSQFQSQIQGCRANPTIFGDEFLRILKTILASSFSVKHHKNAEYFNRKSTRIFYKKFKTMLLRYLMSCPEPNDIKTHLELALAHRMNGFFAKQNLQAATGQLRLETCNAIVNFLTTEDYQTPSILFLELVDRGKFLTLVSTLMKLLLVSPQCLDRLEQCLAALLRYYESQNQTAIQRVIPLFEILKIALAMGSKEVEYSLIAAYDYSECVAEKRLDNYRVFTQLKSNNVLRF